MKIYISKNKKGQYAVKKSTAKRASKIFDTYSEAISYASNLAKETGAVIIDETIKDIVKKRPKVRRFLLILLIIILIVAIVGAIYHRDDIKDYFATTPEESSSISTPSSSLEESSSITTPSSSLEESSSITTPSSSLEESSAFIDENLQFHFLELGNKYAGDSTYIKAGDIDILIDAGSRESSAKTIAEYIDQYCTDGKIEYLIATHAHQDHIAGFVGTSSVPGIFDRYEVETIIDFGNTNATSKVYQNYCTKRTNEITLGATYYTQKQCYYEEDGAKRVWQITETITMTILYNYFCENKASDENDYSVCTLFTHSQGTSETNYLLTGDLEEHGEKKLVENNTLPKVKLFKAGHHGSPTSSNDVLLDIIQPEIVTVCCCAGSNEYTSNQNNQFPSQAFIDRIAKWTTDVYVTTLAINDANGKTQGFTSMNGNIVIASLASEVTITCTNNTTVLKDTDWFKENRVWPT